MSCSLQTRLVCSSQRETCTSPICALPSSSIESLDCPIPPPIVKGNSPASKALWKGSLRLSFAPDFSSCSSKAFSATRMINIRGLTCWVVEPFKATVIRFPLKTYLAVRWKYPKAALSCTLYITVTNLCPLRFTIWISSET